MIKINKILTTGTLGAILAIGLTGCLNTTAYPPEDKKLDVIPKEINLTYKFKDEINKTNISNEKIIGIFQKRLSKNSNIPDLRRTRRINSGFYYYQGKKIYYSSNTFYIDYINGGHQGRKDVESSVKFEIPIKIKQMNQIYNINIKFNKNYTIVDKAIVLGDEITLIKPLPVLKQDAIEMFNSLKTKPITISRSIEFKGEINTKFPDKAIYANFKRILGEFVNWRYWNQTSNEKISESKKQNSFNLKIRGNSHPLHVEVYPYRDGSKVRYSTTIKYTIDSNGNSTLSEKDVENLHKRIKNIINN